MNGVPVRQTVEAFTVYNLRSYARMLKLSGRLLSSEELMNYALRVVQCCFNGMVSINPVAGLVTVWARRAGGGGSVNFLGEGNTLWGGGGSASSHKIYIIEKKRLTYPEM
ncbi:hypothetical protein AA106555_1332 [Neokomagataea thailandica NBRC 106555]|uniref:Uncharacterized protein n=1 Tax=Neokomagataea thailandica NBRC 106555 TaxID=1223520 RepID=A0ABQ0QQR6_9PROT|nr:hypothetical protein AA106555_1332 [Neokomagataea thailandica NBRC 106555]